LRGACISKRRTQQATGRQCRPPRAAAIAVCIIGVVGNRVYPAPWVAAAMRVASTLF
jgi:hypothetical protein